MKREYYATRTFSITIKDKDASVVGECSYLNYIISRKKSTTGEFVLKEPLKDETGPFQITMRAPGPKQEEMYIAKINQVKVKLVEKKIKEILYSFKTKEILPWTKEENQK